jgi:hypothetical protein
MKIDILQSIYLYAVEFESETGRSAKTVYLGKKEIKDLYAWLHSNGYSENATKMPGEDTNLLFGWQVFEVNSDSHIGVSC